MTTDTAKQILKQYMMAAKQIAIYQELLTNEDDPSERSHICGRLSSLYELAKNLELLYPQAAQILKSKAPDIYYHITTGQPKENYERLKDFA